MEQHACVNPTLLGCKTHLHRLNFQHFVFPPQNINQNQYIFHEQNGFIIIKECNNLSHIFSGQCIFM